ncbi:helix-turn-helix domain-containing protein [Pseudomonas sp. KSR10]|jgi:AraC family ethanolamine operon transcriptional activator|uniref:AraC family transcriptional regulator n=1 Tax=Stutzerimonas stutzeri TaxID=316 RepID=A0A0D9AIB1_STUST|nr:MULTISPECIES: helix-turn-helix domain-containing protein [Pseudomonadaceae]KJH80492.1 AraC family transcriptional regulator [Stutzerimonas stutzeri]MCG6541964.1 helix-turn-helix domain-containing protein [Pseudomonas sp. KSR10]
MHSAIIDQAVPLPIIRYRQTFDIEDHAGGLDGWQLRYDQLTPGVFKGSISQMHLEGLQLVHDRANQAMTKQGETWKGAISFSLPLHVPNSSFHCLGHSVIGRNLLVTRGEDLPELRTPADLDLLCIAVDESLLRDRLERNLQLTSLPSMPHWYRMVDAESHTALVELCSSLLDAHANKTNDLLGYAAIRAGIRDAVVMHLLDLIDDQEVNLLEPNARKRLVDRAREYALANRDAPPTILELCDKVGASRRKLQYCFQETLGINPVAYLRALRLNAAHRALITSDGTLSVQTVAASWGFWHLSRFASDYRQLFGELPSDTLRRAR